MFRTVTDLKNYIVQKNISPEVLAKSLSISNMTIRRLLKKPPSSPIPSRYQLIFKWLGHPQNLVEGSETKTLSAAARKKFNRVLQNPKTSEPIRAVLVHLLSGMTSQEISKNDRARLLKAIQVFLADY